MKKPREIRRPRLRTGENAPDGTPAKIWFDVPVSEGVVVSYCLIPAGDEQEKFFGVAEVRVYREDGGDIWEGLATLIRDEVTPGKHLYETFPALLMRWKTKKTPIDEFFSGSFESFLEARGFGGAKPRERKLKRGPKPWPDETYLALAEDYVQRCKTSDSPVEDMAREARVKPATMRSRLNTARNLGLLTRGSPGRAGGELTARAERMRRKEKS